jgi:CRISPR-associated protein Csx3
MVNLLPAVIVGGPPHMGKSVLFYNLARALRERGVIHHAIRACPDGEGNWSQEVEQAQAQEIRKKGEWTTEFITRISRDIEQRLLPMLVDVGGKPQWEQDLIFQQCTHALLLLPIEQSSTSFWLQLVERNGLLLLAQLYSELGGVSTLQSEVPVICGTIGGLERGMRVQGQVFEMLVERIATLFRSYTEGDLELEWLHRAPTEVAISLRTSLQAIAPEKTQWEPEMLPRLLARLSRDMPLSVYGHGPQWLYATLAAYVGSNPFYQFDPRLGEQGGWIAPPVLHLATHEDTHTLQDVEAQFHTLEDVTIVSIKISTKHLDYVQSNGLSFPAVDGARGVLLNGSMPAWLLTALVRLYISCKVPWIACHAVNLKRAIVVYSRVEMHKIGSMLTLPHV